MANSELLDYLGKTVMSKVRDYTIDAYDRTTAGSMNSDELRILHRRIDKLSADHKTLLRDVVIRTVDDTLHNFLWMLEQHEDIQLIVTDDDGNNISAAQASDGLCGELYTADGWTYRFSKHK